LTLSFINIGLHNILTWWNFNTPGSDNICDSILKIKKKNPTNLIRVIKAISKEFKHTKIIQKISLRIDLLIAKLFYIFEKDYKRLNYDSISILMITIARI